MKALMEAYDQTFICSDDAKSNVGLMAVKSFGPALVLDAFAENKESEYTQTRRTPCKYFIS